MKKIPVLIQLYSIIEDLNKDFTGTIVKLKEMGYDGVEYCGNFGGFTAAELAGFMKEQGLIGISAHVSFNELSEDIEKTIDFYKQTGCRFITIPWLDQDLLPGGEKYEDTKNEISRIGKKAAESGLKLLYHNHDFEFLSLGSGYKMDKLLADIPSAELAFEADVCWVKVAGVDPIQYMEKYSGRIPVLHIKDFTADVRPDGTLYNLMQDDDCSDTAEIRTKRGFDFRPVGYGLQNVEAIVSTAQKTGVEYLVVEQDRSTQRPAMDSAEMSINYLKQLL